MAATDKPKGPEAFRTISEVGQDLDLPQHVLRFWETRFTQIKPMKRGGGRRYYRPEDVDLLKGIRLLLYGEGFTIRGVQRLLKDRGIAFVAEAGRNGSVVHEAAAPDAESEPDARRSRLSAPEIEVPDDLERDEDSEEFGAAPAHGGPEAETASPPPRVMVFEGDRLRGLERALVELAEAKRILEEA